MILDMTVKNFLSFKDEQVFSLYAESNLEHHKENIVYPDGDKKHATLKVSGIMGANASGKSNLLKCFHAIRFLVVESGGLKDKDEIRCYEPYLLSEQTHTSTISFEIEFWLGEARFNYQIEYDRFNIVYEKLSNYPKGTKAAKLFERTSPTNWQTDDGISFGSYYKGGKKRFAYFSNNSFLSKAGNSPESPPVIKNIYNYFRHALKFTSKDIGVTISSWKDNVAVMNTMNSFITNIDLGISNFEFKEVEPSKQHLDVISAIPFVDEVRNTLIENAKADVVFNHMNEDGVDIEFPSRIESLGTRELLATLPIVLGVLHSGAILFCDEIESSFHSHVVELIIKLFQDPTINVNSAQLIFTTHNLHTMTPKMFRKDQIWLAEKKNGSTELSSLDQFDSTLRDNSPFNKWYDDGRLGGIPSINYKNIKDCLHAFIGGEDA